MLHVILTIGLFLKRPECIGMFSVLLKCVWILLATCEILFKHMEPTLQKR